MRVLITGAAGFLGQNLVRYIRAHRNWEIVATDLRAESAQTDGCATYVQADINDVAAMCCALRGVDLVVHCASAAPSHSAQVIDHVNVGGSRALTRAMAQMNVPRVVYISSTAVYGIPDHAPMTEASELQPYHDPYNISKVEAETVFEDFRTQGHTVTILRPRTFTGPGRLGTFAILSDWASSGKNFPLLGPGTNRYQFLDIDDLCMSVLLAAEADPDLANTVYNIGAERFQTITEDYQAVLDRAGFGKRIINLPAKPFEMALRALEVTKLSPLYGRLYKKLKMDYFVSIDKAKRDLGFHPKYSNAESLVRTYDWYMVHHSEFGQGAGKNNNEVWQQGLLRLGKLVF